MDQFIDTNSFLPADSFFARSTPRSEGALTPAVLSHFRKVCRFIAHDDAPLRVRLGLILRSARALLLYREHAELCSLDTYAQYVVPVAAPDLFHHMSRRHYLAKNLSLRQRVDFLLTHYRFEEASFNLIYKRKVYRDGGLVLWSRNVRGAEFEIRLGLADRYAAEGDLSATLLVDGERLHCIGFSWANAEFARSKKTIVPFITSNQPRWRKDENAQAKFDAAFPQHAPNFACFAAMQGIAQAIGASEMLAVSSELQVCYQPADAKHFGNAYDIFWNAVGGAEVAACGFALPVPRPLKPIEEVAEKHRRRSAAKRKFWGEITDSTKAALTAHFRAH